MKTIVHVNQHIIKKNKKSGMVNAPLTVKTYKSNEYGNQVTLKNKAGEVVGMFKYSPDKPLPCGAHVWFESDQLTIEVA